MKSIKIEVKGIVQGVGFRPYVYKLALQNNLFGWVNNDDRGVNIAIEGDDTSIEIFLETLKKSPPPLSKINSLNIENQDIQNFKSFKIIESQNSFNKSTIISPDIAVCDDCIDDIKNQKNFRYNYALTNCTNCGPRYSIINTVPYDRCNTSMADFIMCEDCKSEYENPLDRRYHAQPVSCEKCGPKIALYDNKNNKLDENYNAIKQLAQKIEDGKIVAIKGMGGFHIVCDAINDEAVKLLREKKVRPTKPFAVMFKTLEEIEKYANITHYEKELLLSKEKPITLIYSKNRLSKYIAPNIDRIGCFIAYTPLHILLFENLLNPIVATSANLSGEPIITNKDEIIEKLFDVVDFVLDFNRDILNACDDSVVQIINTKLQVLRNARGYAPTSIKLEKSFNKKILALGANQKSTISIAFEDNIILSPHIADLETIKSVEYFNRTIKSFERFYDFKPDLIVCDKHPNYETTKWAKSQNIELVQIQHHYAHMLSTMAEYNLQTKVLAFCFDGTGYGDDGNIWGGEVFIGDNKEYERVHHFKYFKLLGAQKAVKEQKRVALSLLFENFSLEELAKLNVPTLSEFSETEIKMMHKMWEKGLNAPLTSSCGRLFDAMASLLGISHTQSYEGETGLQIEMMYDENIKEFYEFDVQDKNIDISKLIKSIIKESDKKVAISKFINGLVELIFNISQKYDDLPIVLTGGVFQNRTLLELVLKRLENKEVYTGSKIPPNDGGISIGQIYSQV